MTAGSYPLSPTCCRCSSRLPPRVAVPNPARYRNYEHERDADSQTNEYACNGVSRRTEFVGSRRSERCANRRPD